MAIGGGARLYVGIRELVAGSFTGLGKKGFDVSNA